MAGISATELLDDVSLGALSASSAAVLFTTDTTGFSSVAFHLTANPGGSNVVLFESSNDNATWVSVASFYAGSTGASAGDISPTITFPGVYVVPVTGKYLRARISSYTSGTVTALAFLRTQQPPRTTSVVSTPSDANLGTVANATSATNLFSMDTIGFASIAVAITSAGVGCTLSYEASNDQSTWFPVAGQLSGSPGPVAITSTTTGLYLFPCTARYFRARVSTYGSGTVTGQYALRQNTPEVMGTVGNTPLDGLTPTAVSVSSATTIFTQDTAGYGAIAVQVTAAGTGCTITYEQSNDNATWVGCAGNVSTSSGSTIATSTSTGLYIFPCIGRYFRARVSTYGSATVTAQWCMRQNIPEVYGTVGITGTVSAIIGGTAGSNSTSKVRLVAAGTTNLTAIKGSAGRVMSIVADNAAAYDVFIKLYNTASGSVVVGTTAIIYTLRLKAGTTTPFSAADFGFYFSTAISFSVTKLVADSDTTALVANDCIVQVDYV